MNRQRVFSSRSGLDEPPTPAGAGDLASSPGEDRSTLARAETRLAGRRRRRFALAGAAIAALAVVAGAVVGSGHGAHRAPRSDAAGGVPPRTVVLRAGEQTLASIPLAPYLHSGHVRHGSLAGAVERALPAAATVAQGRVRIHYRYDRAAARRAAAAMTPAGGAIAVPARAVWSSIRAPIVGQRLRDDCEATALQILLATVSVPVDQLELQRELPRSGPLDPDTRGGGEVWGDPETGFVGRADGSGPAGGFGVYERPVRAVAARHGVRLVDLTGASPQTIYRTLLSGHAVQAWVGLSDGPYAHWRTTAGKPVTINYGEHSIVLNGVRPDRSLRVVNPLTGAAETWTTARFETEWARLGRRALATG